MVYDNSNALACSAAVGSDRDRIAQRLNDDVIRGLFGIGLRLQATAQLADEEVQARLEVAIRDLDLMISEVRGVVFDRVSGPQQIPDGSTSGRVPPVSPLAEELATVWMHGVGRT